MTPLPRVRPAASGSGALVALCVGVCLGLGTQARAQMVSTDGAGSARPFQSLFGGAVEQPRGNQSLVLSGALFAGYDDDIFARGQNPNVGRPRVSGTFLGTQASASYSRRFATSSFGAAAAGAARYVTDSRELVPTFASGSMGYDTSLGSRTNLMFRQAFAYRPFYSPAVFPPTSTIGPSIGAPIDGTGVDEPGTGPPDDFTLASDRDGIRYTAFGQLGRRLSSRSRVELRTRYGVAGFGNTDPTGDIGDATSDIGNSRWLAGVNYAYDVSRDLSANVGYNYRSFSTSSGTQVAHDLNIGVAFNRAFVLQRGQTTFSFTPGTTMLRRTRLSGDTGSDRLRVRVIGAGNVTHRFTTAWQGTLDYVHYVGFLDGFTEPVEGDRFGAGIGGLLTRAVDISAGVGYLTGAIGMRERNFDTALANARLRVALHTRVALFAQYFYYMYSYKDGVADDVLAAPELERQGFRAGLNIWLPVIR